MADHVTLPPINFGGMPNKSPRFPAPASRDGMQPRSRSSSQGHKYDPYGFRTNYRSRSPRHRQRERRNSTHQFPTLRSKSTPAPTQAENHTPRANDSVGSFAAALEARQKGLGYFAAQSGSDQFIKRSSSEECLICMLKIPHAKCQGHRYIRVGGGYRHSYWHVKALLEEIELRRQQEEILQQRLEAIHEKNVKVIKTYVRTKSGRLQERFIYVSEEDYIKFKRGGGNIAEEILKKYLSKDEAKNLVSWEKEEQKAVTTYIRTKSGRRIAKTIYVSKSEYEAMKRGEVDATTLLRKHAKLEEGETVEGWGEAEMKTIKTFVRTKSGRLIEKTVVISKEDYEKMEQLKREGKDPTSVLKNYMSLDDGVKIESWSKQESKPMKVVKAMVRTRSGKLVEKVILMTEEEYEAFQAAGGDVKQLKKYLHDLGKDDVIEDWEKASTVYDASDDEDVKKGIPGTRVVGKDGKTYEIVVDPITGKKYKKRICKESDADSGFASMKNRVKNGVASKAGKLGIGVNEEDPTEAGMTKEQKVAYRAGKRREDSDSEYSYRSVVSAGGTRTVKRRRKREDGTYSAEESYHSDQDVEGKKRRQKRRTERKTVAIKERKKRFDAGKRNTKKDGGGSDSDFSYRSVVSAGGTRHVKRRRKREDGTYSAEESYHSSQDEEGMKRRQKRRKKRVEAIRKGARNKDSDSDYSYRSVHSAGGTRTVKRRRKRADGTYSAEESYHSSQDEGGRDRRRGRRAARQKAFKVGKRNPDSDGSEFSYRSVVSAGGTRHVKRRRKKEDGTYSAEESYHSSQDEAGQERRRRRRRERKHAGSAHSYYSVVSDGGTRHVKRRRKKQDGTYSASESYHSEDSDFFDKKHIKKKMRKKKNEHGSGSDHSYFSEVSEGGTRTRKRKKKIRDAKGRVIGYGKAEDYTSPSEYETDTDSDSSSSAYTTVSDGKGGRIVVRKPDRPPKNKGGKGGKDGKGGKGGRGGKGGKDGKGRRGGGPDGNMSDFSEDLLSTDSEDEPDFTKMTEKEKKEYFEAKAKRKAEREKKRREKYGDKYEEMLEKHDKAKKAEKAAKSMVSYQKGGRDRFGSGVDDRGIGLGHESWGKKDRRKSKFGTDGNEADDESEYDEETGQRRRKKKGGGDDGSEYSYESDGQGGVRKVRKKKDDDEESIYEYARDEKGNILRDKDGKAIMRKVGTIKKGKKKGPGLADSDDEFDYKYDQEGNLVRVKKGEDLDGEESDGDYFETMPDGTIRLKAGKKKIDINKLSAEDLAKLGIDVKNMSRQEIARILKEKFGDEIRITKGGKKVGLKPLDAFSGHNTDELANDSDLDISTLKGQKRIRVLMKRGGAALMDHLKKLLESSQLVDEISQHPDERDASIDFLSHYRLVEPGKAEVYARAFAVEDEDMDCVVSTSDVRIALEGVPSVQTMSPKQLEYVLKVLDIDKETNITFRMFAVMTALAERVTHMDTYSKKLLEASNLIDIQRKMELYKAIFYCNVQGDRDPNYIKAESLQIELIAGGLSWEQQQYVMEKMQPNSWREISFLDYLAYIPLFMSMHDKMISNPFDMSNNKYQPTKRVPSGQLQRDMNPLGSHLRRDTLFMQRTQRAREMHKEADNLLSGRRVSLTHKEHLDLFNKYQKLPGILQNQAPGSRQKIT